MNLGSIASLPPKGISLMRPQKVTPHGNLFKVSLSHGTENGQTKKYEVWTTREAVQKHYQGMKEEPKPFQIRKFAQHVFEKESRANNGVLPHTGILATTDNVTHGNPELWPNTISHPEVKYS